MRFNEKTFEINYCAQASAYWAPQFRTVWWGLTQRQERQYGFDAATMVGSRYVIFQFKMLKRTNTEARYGELRYQAEHFQMVDLRRRAKRNGAVFYVLPTIETMAELLRNSDLIQQSWLLDVAQLPDPIQQPSGVYNIANRRGVPPHRIYLTPPTGVVHSEPMDVKVKGFKDVFKPEQDKSDASPEFGFSADELSRFVEYINPIEEDRVNFAHTYVCAFLPAQ